MSHWRIYIVMVWDDKNKKWDAGKNSLGAVAAYHKLKDARKVKRRAISLFGRGKAYIQKCGAIS